MSEPAKKGAIYEDLCSIPENMTGEIIDGELFVHPRPSRKHIYATSALEVKIGGPYQFGEGGGPGGWIILVEPEIQLGEHIIVPDLAGWKEERYPEEEPCNPITVAPDWVCEVLSPNTAGHDRVKKMAKYAKFDVGYAWLLDPVLTILEAYRLESGRWSLIAAHEGAEKVRVEPFHEVEIDLGVLWRQTPRA
jgi:Uma2 family endonuclease